LPELGILLNSAFKRWKTEDEIFLFLEAERNSILKEGLSTIKFGVGPDFRKGLAIGRLDPLFELAQRILSWWERQLERIEDQASLGK
jgi:hypothetical protein